MPGRKFNLNAYIFERKNDSGDEMLAQKSYSQLVREITEKVQSEPAALRSFLRTDDAEQKLWTALASSGAPYNIAHNIITFIFYDIPNTSFLKFASTNETESDVFRSDTYESARAVAQKHLQDEHMDASSWDSMFGRAYEAAWNGGWDMLCTVVREAAHYATLIAMHGWKSMFAEYAARDAELKVTYMLLDFECKSEYQTYVESAGMPGAAVSACCAMLMAYS